MVFVFQCMIEKFVVIPLFKILAVVIILWQGKQFLFQFRAITAWKMYRGTVMFPNAVLDVSKIIPQHHGCEAVFQIGVYRNPLNLQPSYMGAPDYKGLKQCLTYNVFERVSGYR